MERYVIVVAGGEGVRMQRGIPKQFIPIADKPVLMHTISAFKLVFSDLHVITVLPEKYINLWKELCVEFSFNIPHTIARGGKTRFHSVQNGLKQIKGEGLVGVHDGVRPFVAKQTIRNVYQAAEDYGAAVPVIELNDSVRKMTETGGSTPVDRNVFRLVQTPQCFQAEIIRDAYRQTYRREFTDDASVVEAAGHPITLTEGNFENIKITRTIDLAFAEVLTKKRFVI